ncbi:unnamed protein product [Meloidogyne enterolobii]|uniref:Uncharacterized protein n=1 Tax=Meloidogyne enterolobii TaxID=390850 RepID=A0ACB1AWM4_MELEN
MEDYDIFEVKANEFQQIFNQMSLYSPINHKYRELTPGILNYSKIIPNESIEVHPKMKVYWPLIYKNVKADTTLWTGQECYNLCMHALNPLTQKPLISFYLFFYHLDDLSKNMLDHLILNKLAGEIMMSRNLEYLEENIVELSSIQIPNHGQLPPHLHEDLTRQVIYFFSFKAIFLNKNELVFVLIVEFKLFKLTGSYFY